MVVQRYRYAIEKVSQQMKGAATRELIAEDIHPFSAYRYRDGAIPTPWARRCWSVFLDSESDIRRAVRYVEQNPVKERKRMQEWKFVTPLT